MNDILVLQYHDTRITGSFTTIIDLYINLKKYIDLKFKTVWGQPAKTIIKLLKDNNFFGDRDGILKSLTREKTFESETIVCSAKLLADITYSYNVAQKIEFHCKNLIVLDSMDLMKSKYGFFPDINDYVKAENCVFLCNPSNFRLVRYPKYEYYHKFSKERLDSIDRLKNIPYNYKRINKKDLQLSEKLFFENIGKQIFECCYHGCTVNYSTEGMTMKDGLYYYLELFGVDGFKDHTPLNIGKDQIVEKLFMHENDTLLDILL